MSFISYDSNGPQLSLEQQSLCARNIALLKAQREKPLKMPPLSSYKPPPPRQANYKPRPLAAPMPPVRMTSSGPPPPHKIRKWHKAVNVISLLDGIKPPPNSEFDSRRLEIA